MPEACYSASGIIVNGRRIKTFVFTTDLAIIRNCDADAVFAVYPFTPQQAISDAIIKASYIPVFCGVGGGTTKGLRTVALAKDVECQDTGKHGYPGPAGLRSGYPECSLRDQDAGGCGEDPGAVSGDPADRQRGKHGGEYRPDDCGGCKRGDLYAAVHGRAVQGDDGEIPGRIGSVDLVGLLLDKRGGTGQ